MTLTNFYELSDDLQEPGRWHLSGPLSAVHREPFDYQRCQPMVAQGDEHVEITHPGRALDFTLTHFGVPIVSSRVGDVVGAIAGPTLQRIPITIGGNPGYEVWNPTVKVRCLDDRGSDFLKWTEADRRPDKIGGYKMVTKLRIDPSLVPAGVHVFRVDGWMVALIVSEAVADALRRLAAVGAILQPVTNQ